MYFGPEIYSDTLNGGRFNNGFEIVFTTRLVVFLPHPYQMLLGGVGTSLGILAQTMPRLHGEPHIPILIWTMTLDGVK